MGRRDRNGRWYLVGHDRDRDAKRTFRLSRIGDDVVAYGPADAVRKPDGIDLRQVVDRIIGSPRHRHRDVWVADGRATRCAGSAPHRPPRGSVAATATCSN